MSRMISSSRNGLSSNVEVDGDDAVGGLAVVLPEDPVIVFHRRVVVEHDAPARAHSQLLEDGKRDLVGLVEPQVISARPVRFLCPSRPVEREHLNARARGKHVLVVRGARLVADAGLIEGDEQILTDGAVERRSAHSDDGELTWILAEIAHPRVGDVACLTRRRSALVPLDAWAGGRGEHLVDADGERRDADDGGRATHRHQRQAACRCGRRAT